MNNRVLLGMLIMTLPFSGCVWKSEYKTKLTEIDGLQKNVAGLEEQNRARDKEIADLKQKLEELTKQREQLEKEKATLTRENADIKTTLETKRDKLANEVVDLKSRLLTNEMQIAELKALVDQLSHEKAKAVEEKERAIAGMKNTYESLLTELKQEIKEGEIQITQLKDKLTVNMVDKVLFDSGSAVIKKNGKKVLDRVAEILKSVKNQQIKVEGHTDNVPIGSGLAEKFPSNWELSTARATTVVRYLQERTIDPGVLSAEGYAEYRPVATNDTDAGKAKNRRIEIVLVPLDANK